jgi:glycosyltransferase involved in cell wall biosynthesis
VKLKRASTSTNDEALRIVLSIHHGLDRATGAPGVTIEVADRLRRRGHEVTVLSFDDLATRWPERAKMLLFPLLVLRRVHGIGRQRVDVLDASTGDAALLAILPRRLRPAVVVTRSHGLEALEPEPPGSHPVNPPVSLRHRFYMSAVRLPLVGLSLRTSTGVTVLNSAEERYVDGLRRAPRVRCIGNGIPADLRRLEDGSRGSGLAYIGSYLPRKGVDVLAAAVAPILAERPELDLVLLGTGATAEQVLVDYPPAVHPRITVVPRFGRAELPLLLRNSRIFVFPTYYEGGPVALLEAMACGLVPVSSTVPGPSDVIDDGVNGLLVGPGDELALSAAVRRVLDDVDLCERLAASAAATAKRYTWDAVIDQTLCWYRDLARRWPVQGPGDRVGPSAL